MLNLVSAAGQLLRMRTELATLADETGPRLEQAVGAWGDALRLGPELGDRVLRARTSWLVAEPLEPLGAYPVAPADDYSVVASDGSQIFPDRHELPHCYLVNVGLVDIDYATSTAKLDSEPVVTWLPEDMYPLVGGLRQEADARVVAARRFQAESDALAGRLRGSPRPVVALIDGTLLLWWLEPDPERLLALEPTDVKSRTFASLQRLLARAQDSGALVAGYLSAPRSTDVVSMLKVVLCTEPDPVDCDRCPYASGAKTWTPVRDGPHRLLPVPSRPCEEADTATDAGLFGSLLRPGERSPRFRSAAKVAAAYDAPVDFVYIHTGTEIARLELPAWVDPGGLETLVASVADQCRKGRGYPVALAEAHEQAVVRAPERAAFIDLVRRGEPLSRTSTKLARKRMSVL